MLQLDLDLSARTAAIAKLAGRRVVASVSGGRDSAAMSLYLTELGIEHDRMFLDTGWEHPMTYEYLRGPLTKKLGPIIEVRGPLTFEQLVEKKGLFPSRVMRFCTTAAWAISSGQLNPVTTSGDGGVGPCDADDSINGAIILILGPSDPTPDREKLEAMTREHYKIANHLKSAKKATTP